MDDLFTWASQTPAPGGMDHNGFFSAHYAELSYPIETEANPTGFRPAQIAAIQAASAHLYTRPEQPGIIVMPTGSGKSAVMNALAFTTRAERVLVLTPSRLVREQLADGFKTLSDLREIGAVPASVLEPRVFSTRGRVGSDEAWEELRAYDVVVATVPSVSPKDLVIPSPPDDLFDLILIDEAHHAAAPTWKAILNSFPKTQKVHFTATPFRGDDREIPGRVVFVYDIRRAFEDKVFGDIRYEAVEPQVGQNHDEAIAISAESRLRADQQSGFKHLLMVRTDTRARANELKKIYAQHTGLNLRLVAGDQSLKYVRGIVDELRNFQLDGVICVNMLAEGFNLPNLKVAAVHAPHKSLAVTLQFIGRFARTTGQSVGPATFLAVPSEIRIEATKLFQQDVAWREIVQNLSATRVAEEVRVREYLDTFEPRLSPDMAGFSLYSVRPYYHVKILEALDGVDFDRDLELPGSLSEVYRGRSADHDALISIGRETWLPPWSEDDRLENVGYELFLLHFNAQSRLLFICSTRRSSSVYDSLAGSVATGRVRLVSLYRLNRVLNDLEGMELFNLGMRNRTTMGNSESYRTVAGPAADRAVQPSDGRLYDRGHCFGRAAQDGEAITIGLSSASKVWSNTSSTIPDLIAWCDRLAAKITSNRQPLTHTGIDYLSAGEEVAQIPANLRFALWPKDVYLEPPRIRFEGADGEMAEDDLLNLDIQIEAASADSYLIKFSNENTEHRQIFSLSADKYFTQASADEPEIFVMQGHTAEKLEDFLNDGPLSFYSDDLSRLEGNSFFPAATDVPAMDPANYETVAWDAQGVAPDFEKPPAPAGKVSIFEWLEARLVASAASIVFCDDGAGEMADYIAIYSSEGRTRVCLYHCKGSGGAPGGDRVDDAYEVCGQAVKSLVWTRPRVMLKKIASRLNRAQPSRFAKGDLSVAEALLGDERPPAIEVEIFVVQPGFREAPSEKIASLLASANDYIVHGGALPLRAIGSA